MSMRNPIRDTWRHRFLEIARRYEATGPGESAPAIAMPELRRRARMAGFATLHRPRVSPPR
ncbi:MAG TPA: hypothetical protein VKR38_02010 [Usitatibacter sp.]|nr:hypothetical protein [Usitatibacter sp.]